jgi:hypothetical protein
MGGGAVGAMNWVDWKAGWAKPHHAASEVRDARAHSHSGPRIGRVEVTGFSVHEALAPWLSAMTAPCVWARPGRALANRLDRKRGKSKVALPICAPGACDTPAAEARDLIMNTLANALGLYGLGFYLTPSRPDCCKQGVIGARGR